jgi:hypothetical protein
MRRREFITQVGRARDGRSKAVPACREPGTYAAARQEPIGASHSAEGRLISEDPPRLIVEDTSNSS